MNAQDIFDTVVTHLYRQGHRSVHTATYGTCMYRGEKGDSCAVGCLISDEAYSKHMETRPVVDISAALPAYLQANTALLTALQEAHDHTPRDVSLATALRNVAEIFDLEYRASFYPNPPAEWI